MSRVIYILSCLFYIMALTSGLSAQDDLVMYDGTDSSCDGQFFDDGGAAGGPYSAANYTYTICPDNPGDVIQVEFVAFALQTSPNPNNNDALTIYDGDDTSANSLGTYTGDDLQGIPVTGTTNNTTGCLTFVFTVNTGNTNALPGWEGLVSCTTPCDPPTANSLITDPVPAIDTLQSVGVCIGQEVSFDGSASVAAPGFNLAEYVWNFDDGEIDNSSGSVVSHSFGEAGEYIVSLTVLDNNGCGSLNIDPLQVLVSTTPIFNTDFLPEVCLGGEACADGTPIVSPTWTALPPQVVAGETYLADGAGFSYSTSLTFDFFEPGATLESCDDLLNVLVNMEHSYMGDLQIELECPDGTTVVLVEYPNGGGGTYLGEAVDDGTTTPGVGYDYYWDPDANNGTWGDNAGGFNSTLESGSYESDNDLCDFVGCPLNGDWTFTVIDNLAIDNGYIFYWGINFNPELFPGITTFTPIIGMESDSTWWEADNISFESDDGNQICITPPALGDYDLTYNSINNFGCAFDTTVTITVVPGPAIDAGPDITFCDAPVQLLPDVSVDGNPADCSWTFVLEDTFGDGWNGCSVDILVNGNFEYNLTLNAGSFEEVPISIAGGAAVQIIFNEGAFAGEVIMAIQDENGDDVFSAGPGGFNDGDVVWDGTCGGFGTYVYEWNPPDGLDDPTIPNPTATVSETTTYTVTVYPDGFLGCAASDDVTIQIDPLGDPGQSTDWVFCFHEGEFELIDLLGGAPVNGGTWTDGNGAVVADPTFDTYTDANDVFTYTVSNGGCVASAQVTIEVIPQGDPICCEFEYSESITDPNCFGYTDGSYGISIFESTEGGPWNVTLIDENGAEVGNQNTDGSQIVFADLSGQEYTVELEDAGLCFMSFDIDVVEPPQIILETSADTTICISGTVTLMASSPQDVGANWDYLWDSGLGSGSLVTDTPDQNSTYEVTAVNSNGCVSQPESVNVTLYSELNLLAAADETICQNSDVMLSVDASGGGLGPYEYTWINNGTIIGSGDAYNYFPSQSGTYCVIMNDACETPTTEDCMEVTIETPINVQIASDTTQGCFPADITLMVSPEIDPALYASAQWQLSDGWFELNAAEFEHTFDYPGFYDVSLTLTSPAGCVYSNTEFNYITVYNNPSAGFHADPQPTQAPNTEINFYDWSSGSVVDWYWQFDSINDFGVSFDPNPHFTFPMGQGGEYPVTLTVTDANGCQDDVTRFIVIDDFFNVFVPNSFTPNNDGFNEYFKVEGTDIDPNRYEFRIFNRWGEIIWESYDPEDVWTGGYLGGDHFVPDDTYLWRMVVYSQTRPERHEIFGYVTIVR